MRCLAFGMAKADMGGRMERVVVASSDVATQVSLDDVHMLWFWSLVPDCCCFPCSETLIAPKHDRICGTVTQWWKISGWVK
jgi:hypothetical protein